MASSIPPPRPCSTTSRWSGGNTTNPFDVPVGASLGVTFARFRISAAGGLNPTGPAASGEVEDYQVTIVGCGDNIVQAPEQCDDGDAGNDGCTASCTKEQN
ncbi:MAG: GEVED domain-containing protein [Myxococcota bacterium]